MASLLWRLGRVTRYETQTSANSFRNWAARVEGKRLPTAKIDPGRTEANLDPSNWLEVLPYDYERVIRYETHLERSLYRTLHEIQRLQAIRSRGAPAPLALDVDVSVGPRTPRSAALDADSEP